MQQHARTTLVLRGITRTDRGVAGLVGGAARGRGITAALPLPGLLISHVLNP
jgi:hypothetical protein